MGELRLCLRERKAFKKLFFNGGEMQEIWITAADVSLYHVAARYLGDACQWWRIAELNDLADPELGWIGMPIKISLPSAQPSGSIGIPVEGE